MYLFVLLLARLWRHLTGHYCLIAVDSKEDMNVSYYQKDADIYLGVGGKGVYEVGFDEHFILTKKYKERTDSLG